MTGHPPASPRWLASEPTIRWPRCSDAPTTTPSARAGSAVSIHSRAPACRRLSGSPAPPAACAESAHGEPQRSYPPGLAAHCRPHPPLYTSPRCIASRRSNGSDPRLRRHHARKNAANTGGPGPPRRLRQTNIKVVDRHGEDGGIGRGALARAACLTPPLALILRKGIVTIPWRSGIGWNSSLMRPRALRT